MSVVIHNGRRILTNCRRLTFNARCRKFTVVTAKRDDIGWKCEPPKQYFVSPRPFSTPSHSDAKYIPLMKYPEVAWPSFFQMVKCWLTMKFGIYALDQEFNLPDFIEGTQHAILVASRALAEEDYETLSDIVTPEAVQELKQSMALYNSEQKKEIAIKKEEFFFCFPWEVRIVDRPDTRSKVAEVVMVFHILRNWTHTRKPSDIMNSDAGMEKMELMRSIVSNEDYAKHVIVCNYRFIRHFDGESTKPWLINLMNQFRLVDLPK